MTFHACDHGAGVDAISSCAVCALSDCQRELEDALMRASRRVQENIDQAKRIAELETAGDVLHKLVGVSLCFRCVNDEPHDFECQDGLARDAWRELRGQP